MHHCNTCKRCCLRLDHHCPFLHNCVGLHNMRYFVQLFLISLIGSVQCLFCGYLVKDHYVWDSLTIITPRNTIIIHFFWILLYTTYLSFFWWSFKRDLTSIDFLDPVMKLHFSRIFELSFHAKLYVYFGTPSLWRALLLEHSELPINGLEFEYE